MSAFSPARLAFARSRAGLSRVRLAKAAGISSRMLAYYEDGIHEPPADVLQRLADASEVPPEFFFAPDLRSIPVEAASFRAVSKMSAGRRDAALSSGALAIELNTWLEDHLRLPPPDVPRYERAYADPTSAAQRLRFEWDLGYAPVPNMTHLLESHGVRIFCLSESLVDIDAFSFWHSRTPMALINTRKSAERSRFDLAHELAHLVIHSDYDLPRGRERELEANRFAAAFLMPEDDVLASGLRNAGPEAVLQARARWGVAAMALTHRLHELGITTDWTYTATCRRLSQLGFRSAEPGGRTRETSQLLEKSLAVLRGRGVRLRDVADELSLHVETLQQLLFGLVLTPVDGTAELNSKPAGRLRVVTD